MRVGPDRERLFNSYHTAVLVPPGRGFMFVACLHTFCSWAVELSRHHLTVEVSPVERFCRFMRQSFTFSVNLLVDMFFFNFLPGNSCPKSIAATSTPLCHVVYMYAVRVLYRYGTRQLRVRPNWQAAQSPTLQAECCVGSVARVLPFLLKAASFTKTVDAQTFGPRYRVYSAFSVVAKRSLVSPTCLVRSCHTSYQ